MVPLQITCNPLRPDGLNAQAQPNAVWAADFKGHFKLRTSAKCYPLTISDGFSRYALRCEALRHSDRLSASSPSAAGRAFFLATRR